jgi:hypothetical protein
VAEKQGRCRSLAQALRARHCGVFSGRRDRAVKDETARDRESLRKTALSLLSACHEASCGWISVSASKSDVYRFEKSTFVFAQLPRGPPGGSQRPV